MILLGKNYSGKLVSRAEGRHETIPPLTSPTFVSSLRPRVGRKPQEKTPEQRPARQGPAAFTEYLDGPDGRKQEAGEPRLRAGPSAALGPALWSPCLSLEGWSCKKITNGAT